MFCKTSNVVKQVIVDKMLRERDREKKRKGKKVFLLKGVWQML